MRSQFSWILAYIGTVLAVNVGFVYVPLVDLGAWGMWPPMSLVVGLVFVVRDVAQRACGHWVLVAMLVGCLLSYWLASPYVAIASATAFALSELADWAVYTWTKRPFRDRVLLSSAIGTPIDSAVFLLMIGHFGIGALVTMTASKMLVAALVWMKRDTAA